MVILPLNMLWLKKETSSLEQAFRNTLNVDVSLQGSNVGWNTSNMFEIVGHGFLHKEGCIFRIYSGRVTWNEWCEKVNYIPHSSEFTKKKIEQGISVTLWNASVSHKQLLGNLRSKQVILHSIPWSKCAFCLCHVTFITKKKEYISNACNTHQLMISFSYYLTNNYLDGAESDLRSWYFISWLRNFRRFMNTVVSSPRSQELTTCLNLDPH